VQRAGVRQQVRGAAGGHRVEEGYVGAAGVHLGVSKALHGILLAIMALYWNLDLLRLQAKQTHAYPQRAWPSSHMSVSHCLNRCNLPSSGFRVKRIRKLLYKGIEKKQSRLRVREH